MFVFVGYRLSHSYLRCAKSSSHMQQELEDYKKRVRSRAQWNDRGILIPLEVMGFCPLCGILADPLFSQPVIQLFFIQLFL